MVAPTRCRWVQLDQYADGRNATETIQGLDEQLRSAFPDQGVTARALLTQARSARPPIQFLGASGRQSSPVRRHDGAHHRVP